MVRSTGAPPRDPVTQRGSRIWAIWNLSWDHVGSFLGSKRSPKENFSTEVRFGGSISGRGITSNKKGVVLRVFSGHFEGYVGPMLGNLGSKLGQCFGICWDLRGSSMVFGIKVWTQQKLPFVEIHLGGTWRAMSDPCWANVGSYGVDVGPGLGHLRFFLFHATRKHILITWFGFCRSTVCPRSQQKWSWAFGFCKPEHVPIQMICFWFCTGRLVFPRNMSTKFEAPSPAGQFFLVIKSIESIWYKMFAISIRYLSHSPAAQAWMVSRSPMDITAGGRWTVARWSAVRDLCLGE